MKELLLQSADYIEKNGLAQRVFLEQDGRACIQGAFRMALNLPYTWEETPRGRKFAHYEYDSSKWDLLWEMGNAVRNEILRRQPDHVGGVLGFNDATGRTKEEVVELLRAAAAALE